MDSIFNQIKKLLIGSLLLLFVFGSTNVLAQTIDFQDDFSTNPNTNGKWSIFRYANDSNYEAYWSAGEGNWYLTRNSGDKAAAVFAKYELKAQRWQAKFNFKITGGNGADGFVFMFYKNKSAYGRPQPGGSLGFVLSPNETAVAGYGLEFDTYGDYGISSPHIAIIKDTQKNHLTYLTSSNLRTSTYHNVEVNFQSGIIQVIFDGAQVMNYTIPNMDYTYSGIGFSSATGMSNDNHIVDNFELWVNDIKLVSPDGGEYWAGGSSQNIKWILSGNSVPLVTKFTLLYSTDGGSNYPNLIADNISSSSTSYFWGIPSINSSAVKVKVQAKNASGAVVTDDNSNMNFTIDSTPPSPFNLTSPANGDWTDETPYFQWQYATDNFAFSRYQLWIDGIIIKDSLSTNYFTIPDTKPQTPGIHTWKVTAVDKAGNIQTSTETRSIRVDNLSPAAFDLISPVDNSWTKSTLPTFTWQASSDANSGLKKYQLYIDNYLWKDNISATATSTTISSPLDYGSHSWYILAVDNVSNTKKSNQTWTLKIDNAPPGGIQGIEGKYYSNPGAGESPYFGTLVLTRIDNTINFNWGGGSPASSVPANDFQVRWTGYIETAASGTYTFKTMTDDGVRLWINNQYLINKWIDMTMTPVSATTFLEANKFVPIKMEYYENEGGASAQLYWTPPGKYEEIIPASQFNVYQVPSFEALSPLNNTWTNIATPTFVWKEAVDPGIGLSKYQLWIDNAVKYDSIPGGTTAITLDASKALTSGNHTWYVKAFDKLGNSSQTTTWTIRVDIQPPNAFSLTSPKDSAYVNFPTPNFSWNATSDVGSGLAKYQLWIDNILSADNITTTTSAPGTPLNEGYHYWFVKAIDNVGNERKSNETRIVVGEWSSPSAFDLASPRNNETITTSKPILSWHPSRDLGAGLKKYELWIGASKNRDNIPPTDTSTTPFTNLANGTYNWFIKAVDKVGNETPTTSIWQFIVNRDITPPISTITQPVASETIGGTSYTIKGTADDGMGTGVNQVEVSFDNGVSWKLATNMGTNFNTWEYVWSGYASGTYTIKSRATDYEGNIEIPKSGITVNVNLSAPSVKEVTVIPNPSKAGPINITVIFTVNQSDMNNSVIPLVSFSPANDTTRYPITQSSYVKSTWTGIAIVTGSMNNGIATIQVRGAKDNYGNIMGPNNNAGHFVIDTVSPTVSNVIINPYKAKTGSVEVSINFLEATSGLNTTVIPTVTFTPLGGVPATINQTGYDAQTKMWSGKGDVTSYMSDGFATIQVKGAKDMADNQMVDNPSAGKFLIDVTPPSTFDLLSPADSIWIKDKQPTLSWQSSSDVTSKLAKYQLFINNNLNIDIISPMITSIKPASLLTDGAYLWYVSAIDSAGNVTQSNSSWLLRVDTTPPVSTITNLISGTTVSADTVVIEGTASDIIGRSAGSGVANVFITFDGGNTWLPVIKKTTDFSSWQYDWTGYTNQNYTIKCKAVDRVGNEESPGDGIVVTEVESKAKDLIPKKFTISQNYPNPFNPETMINFEIPKSCQVIIKIYNTVGQEVKTLINEKRNAGSYQIIWDGKDNSGQNVGTGIYIYQLKADEFVAVRKMVMIQ